MRSDQKESLTRLATYNSGEKMRRSRIKVMPTVPARRKPPGEAKDDKDERLDATEVDSRVAAVVLERFEASEGERTAKERETQAVRVKTMVGAPVTAVCKGFGAPDHAPTAKQLSQTRTSSMRPSPRLDGVGSRILRRNRVHGSGASACESEDSPGSTHSSNKAATPTSRQRVVENPPNSTTTAGRTPAKNVASKKSRRKRIINLSESVAKLAKAKREFRLKYKQQQPDRTKLTMYDLIHYNPVTNPMKKTDNAYTNVSTGHTPPPPRLGVEDEEADECGAEEVTPMPRLKVKPDEYDAGEVTLVRLKVEPDECDAGEVTPVPRLKVKPDECEAGEVTPVPRLKVKPDEYDAGEVTLVRLKVEPDECDAGEVTPVPRLKVKPDEYDAGEVTLVRLKVEPDECDAGEVTPVPRLKVKPDEYDAGEVTLVRLKVEPDECDAGEVVLPLVVQLKLEPDDRLVYDERCLVVEDTGTQKSHQALARTEAPVDDDSNGNGFCKKRLKTRDWTRQETLKFYKALNTVGTDFYIMQSLFPERTRREIAAKFKKEDKLNRHKVEKALAHRQEFNIESLQQDHGAQKSQRR